MRICSSSDGAAATSLFCFGLAADFVTLTTLVPFSASIAGLRVRFLGVVLSVALGSFAIGTFSPEFSSDLQPVHAIPLVAAICLLLMIPNLSALCCTLVSISPFFAHQEQESATRPCFHVSCLLHVSCGV